MLTTRSHRPRRIRSTTVAASPRSLTLRTSSTSSPAERSAAAVPAVACRRNPNRANARARRNDGNLVGIAYREEDGTAHGQRPARGPFGLREGRREVGRARHHLAGRPHLGAEHRIRAGEPRERQHGCLDAHLPRRPLRGEPELLDPRAGREPARRLDEVHARRLRRERHRPGSPRIHLEHVDGALDDRELHVQQPDHAQRGPEPTDRLLDLRELLHAHRLRRQHAGGVARVDSRFLHVLHHGCDVDLLAVAERVDVELDRMLEEAIDERRPGHPAKRRDDLVLAVAHPHRAPTEHVRRAHEHRIADRSAIAIASLRRRAMPHSGHAIPSSSRSSRSAHGPRRGRRRRTACPECGDPRLRSPARA